MVALTRGSNPVPVWLRRRLVRALVACGLVVAAGPGGLCGAEWPDEYQAGPFFCHADFPLAPHHEFLNGLPQLERDLSEALGIHPVHEPIHLFLFQKKSTYYGYVKQYFPDVPSRKALFIKGRGPGMVFAHLGDDFEVDLRHECTHALLNASLPMVPLWLDEGLAEYYEVPADQRVSGNPHRWVIQWSVRLSQVPRLEALERVRDLPEMGRMRYRQAWAWVHFMLAGPPEAREELRRFLADIQSLTPPGQLSQRLRERLPDLEGAFAKHFTSGNW